MAYYKDLREHIKALEAHNKLVKVTREINKDTELMPLVRWQFRGLPEEERKAFLFENVIDVKGKRYNMPVLVASHAASREVYALGMMCKPDEIMEKWAEAQIHPIEPKIVEEGPVHEEVHLGDNLLEHGGLEELPVPISTPGLDNAPYLTCANWVSRDPETGIGNIGNYRAMIKSQTRTGIACAVGQDLRTHWEKCGQQGKPLQAAIVIGATPAIGFVSVSKMPLDVDEFAVAGGIANAPIELVRCKTVDLEVPASAEMVIEGEFPTDYMEREAPFGEFTGYMGVSMVGPYFNVTAVTHRRDAIYNAFLSQFPPSESSKIRGTGDEAALYKFLRYDCSLPVLDVVLHEASGSRQYCVIRIKKAQHFQGWQVLRNATINFWQKIIIIVDEDIDPRDPDAVNWALCFRMSPRKDIHIIDGLFEVLDYSAAPPGDPERYPQPVGASGVLIDATRSWDYPPVSLPKKQFMERAREIWEEEGLPQLKPKSPWHGYALGYWTEELEEEADLALRGEHFKTGEKLASQGERVKRSKIET